MFPASTQRDQQQQQHNQPQHHQQLVDRAPPNLRPAAAAGDPTSPPLTTISTAGRCQAAHQQALSHHQTQTESPPLAFAASPGENSLLEYFPPIPPLEPKETTSMGSANSKFHSSSASGVNRDTQAGTAKSTSASTPGSTNGPGGGGPSRKGTFVRALSTRKIWERATSSSGGAKSPPASSSGGAAPRPRSNSTTARTGSPPKAQRKGSVSQQAGEPQTAAQPEIGSRPLTDGDLVRLFSGAPQFSLYHAPTDDQASSTHYTHLPLIPTVTFPYSPSDSHVPQGTDHTPFPSHPSFSLCDSALPSRGIIDVLDPLPSELPPMASFQGLDVGSCGWEHYVLAPIGDANNAPEDDMERDGRFDIDEGGRERGMTMGGGRELAGVMRSVEVGWVVERLKELGELYWVGRSEGDKLEGEDDEDSSDDNTPTEEATGDEKVETVVDPGTPASEVFTATTFGKMKGTGTGSAAASCKSGKPGILSKYTHLELYTNLFTQLLYPPTKITTADYHNPYSLRVQIASLTHALGMPRVWLDFSLVEWRIRLGQVLWGHNWTEELNGTNTERVWLLLQILLACELVVRLDAIAASDPDEQGDMGGVGGNREPKEETFRYFREIRKKKVEWDILLARRWLENVVLVERETFPLPSLTIPEDKESTAMATGSPPKRKGWFSALSSSPPTTSSGEASTVKYDPATAKTNNPAYDALIIPRDQATQLSGLLFFAREINWPQLDTLSQMLVDNLINYVQTHPTKFGYSLPQSVASTPIPMSPGLLTPSESPAMDALGGKGTFASIAAAYASSAGSYFTTSSLRPKRLRELSSRSSLRSRSNSLVLRKRESTNTLMRNNTMGSGGWLSRSWFTGLVLPGESMPHLLISALLENDLNVGENIGWEAELYGGFVLPSVGMWWSSFCIVGKVVAGFGGGRECMGWIGLGKGIKVLTAGNVNVGEDPGEDYCASGEDVTGWVAVRTKDPTSGDEEGGVDAPTVERVDKPREVARMSCILGRGWKEGTTVLDGDFDEPQMDGKDDENMEIEFEGLVFRRGEKEVFDEEEEKEGDEREEDGVAVYDVSASFVMNRLSEADSTRPSSPKSNNHPDGLYGRHIIFHLAHDVTFISAYPCLPPSITLPSTAPLYHHPLHKSHLYTIHPLSSLPVLPAPQQVFRGKPGETSLEMMNRARKASVMVIDASSCGQAGEVFARAWCADRGVRAAILARGGVGRGCISCAVREAGGLGVGVVIWLGV